MTASSTPSSGPSRRQFVLLGLLVLFAGSLSFMVLMGKGDLDRQRAKLANAIDDRDAANQRLDEVEARLKAIPRQAKEQRAAIRDSREQVRELTSRVAAARRANGKLERTFATTETRCASYDGPPDYTGSSSYDLVTARGMVCTEALPFVSKQSRGGQATMYGLPEAEAAGFKCEEIEHWSKAYRCADANRTFIWRHHFGVAGPANLEPGFYRATDLPVDEAVYPSIRYGIGCARYRSPEDDIYDC